MRGLEWMMGPVALLLVGCGPADVEGDWEGTWRSGIFKGGISMSLTQDGDTVDGTFDLDGTGCVGSGSVTGSLSARDLTLELANSVGGTIAVDGRVGAGDDRISGDFEVTGGWCENADGSLELSRVD
jgi:hypothetical protein